MIDTRIVGNLKAIESVAVIPRVASTNLIARRIVAECVENELSLPQAIIIAPHLAARTQGAMDRMSWVARDVVEFLTERRA